MKTLEQRGIVVKELTDQLGPDWDKVVWLEDILCIYNKSRSLSLSIYWRATLTSGNRDLPVKDQKGKIHYTLFYNPPNKEGIRVFWDTADCDNSSALATYISNSLKEEEARIESVAEQSRRQEIGERKVVAFQEKLLKDNVGVLSSPEYGILRNSFHEYGFSVKVSLQSNNYTLNHIKTASEDEIKVLSNVSLCDLTEEQVESVLAVVRTFDKKKSMK